MAVCAIQYPIVFSIKITGLFRAGEHGDGSPSAAEQRMQCRRLRQRPAPGARFPATGTPAFSSRYRKPKASVLSPKKCCRPAAAKRVFTLPVSPGDGGEGIAEGIGCFFVGEWSHSAHPRSRFPESPPLGREPFQRGCRHSSPSRLCSSGEWLCARVCPNNPQRITLPRRRGSSPDKCGSVP